MYAALVPSIWDFVFKHVSIMLIVIMHIEPLMLSLQAHGVYPRRLESSAVWLFEPQISNSSTC